MYHNLMYISLNNFWSDNKMILRFVSRCQLFYVKLTGDEILWNVIMSFKPFDWSHKKSSTTMTDRIWAIMIMIVCCHWLANSTRCLHAFFWLSVSSLVDFTKFFLFFLRCNYLFILMGHDVQFVCTRQLTILTSTKSTYVHLTVVWWVCNFLLWTINLTVLYCRVFHDF